MCPSLQHTYIRNYTYSSHRLLPKDVHDFPPAALPGAHRAGPSSDTSEDGWECDGWRRELGDSEVAEAYMDAKFGGEGADMVEIVGGW